MLGGKLLQCVNIGAFRCPRNTDQPGAVQTLIAEEREVTGIIHQNHIITPQQQAYHQIQRLRRAKGQQNGRWRRSDPLLRELECEMLP